VVLPQHLHGGPEDKPGKTSVTVGSVSADIQNRHLQNTQIDVA
jgi:hypothetical protein